MSETPKGLRSGGTAVWRAITTKHETLDAPQLALLEAACRQRDRADSLAGAAATGDASALRHEREASLAMARLLTAMRLPDELSGRRPQARRMRGVQAPGKVSSLERARQRTGGDSPPAEGAPIKRRVDSNSGRDRINMGDLDDI